MDKVDNWTRVVDRALDTIFAKYPARTGLGVILGCALAFLARLFAPTLLTLKYADFSGAPWWGWIPIGILIMHSPTIVSLFKKQAIGNDLIDRALDLIERANFTQAEKRQQYRTLIERVANSVALSHETQREVRSIEQEILRENPPSQDD
jgi:hypothetical protein